MIKTIMYVPLSILILLLLFFSIFLFIFISEYENTKAVFAQKINSELSFIYYTKINASQISIDQVKTVCQAQNSFPQELEFLKPACDSVLNGSVKTIPDLIEVISKLAANEILKPLDAIIENIKPMLGIIYGITIVLYLAYVFFVFVYARNESMLLFGIIAILLMFVYTLIINGIIDNVTSSIANEISVKAPPDFVGEALKVFYDVKNDILLSFVSRANLYTFLLLIGPVIATGLYKISKRKP
ncbi:MAG: hypothetical protein QXS91_00700 [Candidatus Anstonellales archaeon]